MVNRWGDFGDKVGKWHNYGKGKFSRLLIMMCVVFLVFSILFTVPGIVMLYLPRLCTFLILICVLISFGVTVSGLVLKKINAGVWVMAMLLSVLLLLIGVGLIGFNRQVSMFMMHSTQRFLFSEKTQFPIANLSGIAIDNEGRTYLAIRAYGRIQVYSSEGDFIKGWFVDTEGGDFNIWIEDDHLIHVCTRMTDRHDVFDSSGQLIENIEITSYDEEKRLFKKAGGLKEQDAFGNTYVIQNRKWFPKVVKTNLNGLDAPLIKSPYHFWLMYPPLAAWLIFATGLIMTVILGMIIKKKVYFPKIDAAACSQSSESTELFSAD